VDLEEYQGNFEVHQELVKTMEHMKRVCRDYYPWTHQDPWVLENSSWAHQLEKTSVMKWREIQDWDWP
jgi:hypothetical protein